MVFITATELKGNLGHYLELAKNENIFITKNKQIIAVLSSPEDKAFDNFMSLQGCLSDSDEKDIDYEKIIGEEILKRCGY